MQFLYPWRPRIATALLIATTSLAAHLARKGTTETTTAATAVVVVVLLITLAWSWFDRRTKRRNDLVASTVLGLIHPQLAAKAKNAVQLINSTNAYSDSTANQLTEAFSELHLQQVLSNVSYEQLQNAGNRRIRLLRNVFVTLLAVPFFSFVLAPLRCIEGANVWLATDGIAPLPIEWIDTSICIYNEPAYLGDHRSQLARCRYGTYPVGTIITVRARPRFSNRNLILTDGNTEVAFTADGSSNVRASWKIEHDTQLHVAARFGNVTIRSPEPISLTAQIDAAPTVTLHNPPSTIPLHDAQPIAIDYEATDDHGITQVDLVLQTANQQNRRTLSKHPNSSPFVRSSTVLQGDDPWLKQAYLPVIVTVQARDNDTVSGPKWGKSAPIVIIVPSIGQERALRMQALLHLRDTLVRRLSTQLQSLDAKSAPLASHLVDKQTSAQTSLDQTITNLIDNPDNGAPVPAKLRVFLLRQSERINRATSAASMQCHTHSAGTSPDAPTSTDHNINPSCTRALTELSQLTGDVTYALDAALRSLASSDAAFIARELSEVAYHAEQTAREIRTSELQRSANDIDAATMILDGGQLSLQTVGGLGTDLAEVVGIGVRRIRRCLARDNMECTELAAGHLATRLRNPHPSFSSAGSPSAVESASTPSFDGSANGPLNDSSDSIANLSDDFLHDAPDGNDTELPSESHRNAIEQLAQQHAKQMQQLRDAFEQAMDSVNAHPQLQGQKQALHERAQTIRNALTPLPSDAPDPESVDGSAAQARRQGEKMAEALERSDIQSAHEHGKDAIRAVEKARQIANSNRNLFGTPPPNQRHLSQAHSELLKQQAWLQTQMQQQQHLRESKTKQALAQPAIDEIAIANKTKQIIRNADKTRAPLESSTSLLLEQAEIIMRQAARAMQRAQADNAQKHQQKAQNLLEMARESATNSDKNQSDHDRFSHSDSNQRTPSANDSARGNLRGNEHIDIPSADAFVGPEAFRRRVLQGLSDPADPSLKEAVRRYTEGLLR